MCARTSRAWVCRFFTSRGVPLKNDQSVSASRMITRRQWLGHVPPSAIAAVLGAGLSSERGLALQPAQQNASDDSGARIYNIRKYGAKGAGPTLDHAALQTDID